MSLPLVEKVRLAGVVGAGGAGFPTHVKLASRVDTYIVNGVECEPLLHKDKELMRLQAGRLLEGLRLAMDSTGASRGVIAVKAKARDAIAALEPHVMGSISLLKMENFYPAGDEVQVVYEATGRLIPPAGLPLAVGCAVSNVESLLNVAAADHGQPVIATSLTVAGAVARPLSLEVPIGVTVREVIALAGGATVDDPAFIDGGPMMGPARTDLDQPVTKTTGGIVVLPRDHRLVQRKLAPDEVNVRIARASCDQCTQCTDLCPRYLLGYGIEPHKAMRAVGFAGEKAEAWDRHGLLCCECGACEYYICPESLTPKSMCVRAKQGFAASGLRPEPLQGLGRPHPLREARKIPVPRLVQRLGLTAWDVPAPWSRVGIEPARVRLLLKQHVGAPALPVVGEGELVRLGQVVAEVPAGKLGVPIHASIAGRIARIDATSIWIERN
ncbi:MAG: 4Fe-4S dicluster domain-containing protein [Pseudomonadota bacterium]